MKSFIVKFVKDIFPKSGIRTHLINPKPAEDDDF
jgi:hypothetical protein